MRKAFTVGVHVSPAVVRVVAGLLGVGVIGAVVVQFPDLVRYIRSERM